MVVLCGLFSVLLGTLGTMGAAAAVTSRQRRVYLRDASSGLINSSFREREEGVYISLYQFISAYFSSVNLTFFAETVENTPEHLNTRDRSMSLQD